MKNAKRMIVVALIAVCVVGGAYLGIRVTLNKYDTGTATVWDVIAVNIGAKEYVSIQAGENYERILVRKSWSVENSSIVQGFIFDGQMGSGYPYHDTDGNRITIVGTSDGCPLFRVYTVKEIKAKND